MATVEQAPSGATGDRSSASNSVNRGFVDRALPHWLVADQHVLRIEEQDPHPLDRQVRHVGVEIIEQSLPRAEHRPAFHILLEQPQRRRLGDLERRHRGFAEVAHPLDGLGIGRQQSAETPKIADQAFGERFRVLALDREAEQIFDQFMVEQCVRSAVEQSLPEAGAVPGSVMGLRCCRLGRKGLRRLAPGNLVLSEGHRDQPQGCGIAYPLAPLSHRLDPFGNKERTQWWRRCKSFLPRARLAFPDDRQRLGHAIVTAAERAGTKGVERRVHRVVAWKRKQSSR